MKIIKTIKVLIYLVLFLVLLILMTGFVMENNVPVRAFLFGHAFKVMPLSSLMVIAFVIGGMVGMLSGILMVVRLRLHNASLERKLKRRAEELKKLRVNTLKGLS